MSAAFQELDYVETPLGAISLRRRREPRLDNRDVWEVKLGEEFLMSSLFTASEVALAELTLAALDATGMDVLVGGLGLGYTAQAALAHPGVRQVLVVDALAPVIDWHRRGLVPMGSLLADDPACTLLHADFFARALDAPAGFDTARPGRRFDALLLDIDHSPAHVLNDDNARLYTAAGLAALAGHLRPGGVFGLWSNDPPDAAFLQRLAAAFNAPRAEQVRFANPYTGGEAACTVYIAHAPQALPG